MNGAWKKIRLIRFKHLNTVHATSYQDKRIFLYILWNRDEFFDCQDKRSNISR